MDQAKIYRSLSTAISAVVIGGALALPGAATAFEAKISGQVSRMIVMPDDAEGSEIQHQDIGWSGSRFRFTGSEKMDNEMTVGFRLEIQAQSNSSSGGSGGGQVDGGDDDAIDNRYQDVYFSGNFGKISIGKGDGAANGNTEADLSGTALSSSSNHQDNWGNYRILPGVTWDSVFTMNDGISRVNRLRYDTPSFNGLRLAFSTDQGNATEIGIRYTGDWDGSKLDLRAFTVSGDDFLDNDDIIGFSGSLLLANGFNLTLAFSDRDDDAGVADQEATTVKLGYKTGIHAFTIDIGDGETGSNEADTSGLTYAAFVHPGVELFATVRVLDSDLTGAESVDIAAIGTRVKF